VNLPNGIQADDLLIAAFTVAGSPTITWGPGGGTPSGWTQLFTDRTSSLVLDGQYSIVSAVIDPAGEFAYLGSSTGGVGRIIKVDLAAFNLVSVLTLASGETFPYSAVMAPDGSYAYFGISVNPGIVVKIDLGTFTRVGAIALSAGESGLDSAVITSDGAFAYFGTSTSPGRLVKVDLSTFARVGAVTFASGESTFNTGSAVIDPNNGFVYVGTSTSPGRVVKIGLAPFARIGAITLASGENVLQTASIDPNGAFAYFGTATSAGRVVKINLGSFTRTGAITLSSGENSLYASTIDPTGTFAYFGTFTSPGRVVKINLGTFARTGAITLRSGENNLYCEAMAPNGNYAYFGVAAGTPGMFVRINLTTFTEIDATETSRLEIRYRVADGTEGSTLAIQTTVAGRSSHASYRISGHNPTTPPVASAGARGTSATPNPPPLVPPGGSKDFIWVAVVAYRNGVRTVSSYPSSYVGNQLNPHVSNTAGTGIGMATRDLNAASEDPGAFTLSGSSDWIATTIAVYPTQLAQLVPFIDGMPAELLYGDIHDGTLFPWTVGIASNNYSDALTDVIPVVIVTAIPTLSDCSEIIVQESISGGGTYTPIASTFLSGVCTFQGSQATFGQTVAGGSTSNVWYFKSAVTDLEGVTGGGTTYRWSAQFAS
jgi:hypothetical protein